jgi:hypothetical protein
MIFLGTPDIAGEGADVGVFFFQSKKNTPTYKVHRGDSQSPFF